MGHNITSPDKHITTIRTRNAASINIPTGPTFFSPGPASPLDISAVVCGADMFKGGAIVLVGMNRRINFF